MMPPPATPGIAAGYEAETRALCRQGAETACLLAILLVPPFALLDYIVSRQCFSLFLGMRLGCVVIMGLILAALRTQVEAQLIDYFDTVVTQPIAPAIGANRLVDPPT